MYIYFGFKVRSCRFLNLLKFVVNSEERGLGKKNLLLVFYFLVRYLEVFMDRLFNFLWFREEGKEKN